jgi:type IV pilus assembly protein PilX
MKFVSNTQMQSRQRGAALVIALIMLLVMTVLGITAMQVTRMEERMAGNSRDVNLAFQGAEAGLRDGEARIEALGPTPVFCTAAPCAIWLEGIWTVDPRDQPLAWWTTNGREYGVAGTREVTEVTRDPYVVVEHLQEIRDSLAMGHEEAPPVRDFYRVTANSAGASNTATVVLESTYVRWR